MDLTEVRRALHSMYHGTSPDERRAADRWLQKVQRDQQGWVLADGILRSEELSGHGAGEVQEVLFFAAN